MLTHESETDFVLSYNIDTPKQSWKIFWSFMYYIKLDHTQWQKLLKNRIQFLEEKKKFIQVRNVSSGNNQSEAESRSCHQMTHAT